MKKRKLYYFIAAFLFGCGLLQAQCTFTSQYPFGTNSIDGTPGFTTNVAGCSFAGEYSVNSFTATGSYFVTSTTASDFLTVTDNSNNVLIAGFSPLSVTIPSVGIYEIHVATNASCGTQNSCRDIDVIVPQVPCSTMPASTVLATSYTVCPVNIVDFNLNATYIGSGITYQWESSTAGVTGPYTSIVGANSSTYSASFSSTTWIRAIITCTNGPTTVTSTPAQITVGAPTTSVVPYFESFEGIQLNNDLPNCSWSASDLGNVCVTYTAATGSFNQFANTGTKFASFRFGTDPSGDYFYSEGIQLTAGVTYSASVNFITDGLSGWSEFSMHYGTSQSPTGLTAIASATGALTNTTYSTISNMFTVPTTGLYYIAVKCIGNFSPWYLTWDDLSITQPPVCSGAPAANTIVATSTVVCPGSSANLSLQNAYTTSGITYQWSSATSASGPFTAVSGATLATFSPSNITSNMWYQAEVSCGASTTTVTAVAITTGGNPCSCLAYCTSSASSTGDDEIFNVTIGTLNNSSTCSQTGGPGSSLNRYSNYAGVVAAPSLAAGVNYSMSVTVGQCGSFPYSGGVTVYMDFNQNGVFTDPGEQVYVSPNTSFAVAGTALTTNITVPVTAVTGITRMRVIAVEGGVGQAPCTNYSWGETEDYCINITAPTTCTGAPTSNTAVASMTTVCPGGTATLSLANSYTVGGLAYQWSTATSSVGPWTAVSGATLASYTATNINTSLWYQAVITCTAGPASTTATPVEILSGGNPCICAAYCTSSASSTFDDEIFHVGIGTLANTSNCSQTGGPGSLINRYSNYAGIVAAPSLTVGNTYTLTVVGGQCNSGSYSGYVVAFMDFNQNGAFTDPGELVYTSPYTLFAVAGTTLNANVTIPFSATPGTTRMRVILTETSIVPTTACFAYTWGETEDYCVYIDPGPPCTAASGGTISAPAINGCDTQTIALTSNSVSMGATASYQWMVSNTPGGPYTAVAGGSGSTTPTYTTLPLSTNVYYFVLQTTCASASLTGVSNEATVTINSNPTVMVTPSTGSLCFPGGTPVALSASGAATYSWLPTAGLSSGTGANVNASPAGTIVYTVTGANAAGCTAEATATISALEGPSMLEITASPSVVCSTGSSSLQVLSGLTSSYSVTSIPYAPYTSTGATTLCAAGATVVPLTQGNLDDGGWSNINLPFAFNFFGNGYSQISVSTNGFLTLGGGNPNTTTGYGSPLPDPFAAVSSIGSVYGDLDWDMQGTIETFSAGVAPNRKFIVSWSNGQYWPNTGNVTTQAVLYETSNIIEVHTFTATGDQSATEGIQDATGSSAFVVTGRNASTWMVSTADAYRWSPDGGPITYSWSPSTFLSSTSISNPVASNVNATTVYSVAMTATNGCVNTGTLNLGYDPGPSLTVAATPSMLCGPTASANITASGAATYSWSTGATTSVIVESPAVTTTYSVTGTSTTGCSATSTVVVSVGTAPTVTASAANGTVCAGGSTALNAGGATTYTWSNSANGAVIAVTPLSTTVYTVTGDAGGGCVGTATVQVYVQSLPSVSLTASATTVCVNGPTVALSGSPAGGAYTGTNVTTGVFTPGATAGTFMPSYNVTSTVTGCSNSASVTIVVSPCTGLENSAARINGLSVYPNPNLGEFTVELNNGLNKNIEVSDLTGRIIYSTASANAKTDVNISEFANGVYFVKITSNNTVEVVKVVKQ